MRILGIAGYSGSGKTTLVKTLLPALIDRGLEVSTLKHAHHAFDIDSPGKDSYEHRRAGARQVLISSEKRWALVREHRGQAEPALQDLLDKLDPVDLVLVEGWKHGDHPKLEVHRPAAGTPLLALTDPHVLAVATDAQSLPGVRVPLLALNDVQAIADFAAAYARTGVADA